MWNLSIKFNIEEKKRVLGGDIFQNASIWGVTNRNRLVTGGDIKKMTKIGG